MLVFFRAWCECIRSCRYYKFRHPAAGSAWNLLHSFIGCMICDVLQQMMKDLNFAAQLQRKFGFLQSIPGVFVPHSFFNSTTTGSTRKRGMHSSSVVTHAVLQQEGSSPPNSSAGSELLRGQWMMSSSCTRSTTLQEHGFPSSSRLTSSSIDQFLQQSSRIGSSTDRWSRSCTPSASSCLISAARPVLLSHDQPQLQQTSSSSILGVKRPSDGSEVQASEPASKNLYVSLDQISRNSYPRVDTSTTPPSESRSSPDHQALNISTTNVAAAAARGAGGSSTSPQLGSALGRHHHQLEPSMSSLEALLSKLPSVTPMTDHQPENGSCSSADQQLCCSMSINAAPETTCKPPHLLYAASGTSTSMIDAGSANNTPNASTTPGGAGSVDHDHHLQHITAAAGVQQASRSSSAAAAAAAADHEENLNCSFMENFDTLSDLAAIPDTSSLDNNDSDYTSFLNQIYWSWSRFTWKKRLINQFIMIIVFIRFALV